ncbi:MAG: hypothetical protein M3Y24_03215 [Acidobacteriota bacterium]|nr:hypothetical protein [Acidobacteriota bacterium]
MTIEIHQPELEALIQQRMESGAFRNVEDVLIQALKSLPDAQGQQKPMTGSSKKNFAQFLMESPLPGSGLNLDRAKDYPRPLEL